MAKPNTTQIRLNKDVWERVKQQAAKRQQPISATQLAENYVLSGLKRDEGRHK